VPFMSEPRIAPPRKNDQLHFVKGMTETEGDTQ